MDNNEANDDMGFAKPNKGNKVPKKIRLREPDSGKFKSIPDPEPKKPRKPRKKKKKTTKSRPKKS